ncbi:hypothetical protein CASFOL_033617 [Castilleja foliolosa]|uniref:Uncharacterized protein n=1 Tax=Castilleja foliolosa TaxID=1961234 RepID=A0ABD3BXH9_9LAMI
MVRVAARRRCWCDDGRIKAAKALLIRSLQLCRFAPENSSSQISSCSTCSASTVGSRRLPK